MTQLSFQDLLQMLRVPELPKNDKEKLEEAIRRKLNRLPIEVDLSEPLPDEAVYEVLTTYSKPRANRPEIIVESAKEHLPRFQQDINVVINNASYLPPSRESGEEALALPSGKENPIASSDIGTAILMNRNTEFLMGMIVIACMAYITSKLAVRVLPEIAEIPFWLKFGAAFLCDAVGFMAAKKMPGDFTIGQFEKVPVRNLYLGIFLIVHILSAFCWGNVLGIDLSKKIGLVIVTSYVPMGAFAYSHFYFINDKANDNQYL